MRTALISFTVLALAGIAAFITMEGTYTYVSGMSYFPPSATWQTAPYAISVTVHGGTFKEYSDFSDKHAFVEIYHNRIPIMQKDYVIKGGDLNWKVTWKELSSVQIEFSDSNANGPIKSVETIGFRIDPTTSQVAESK